MPSHAAAQDRDRHNARHDGAGAQGHRQNRESALVPGFIGGGGHCGGLAVGLGVAVALVPEPDPLPEEEPVPLPDVWAAGSTAHLA